MPEIALEEFRLAVVKIPIKDKKFQFTGSLASGSNPFQKITF